MSEEKLHSMGDEIAGRINAEVSTFEGFEVRADAGEAGMVYVALRGAKRELEAGERLAKRLSDLVEGVIEKDEALDFGLGMGRGNKDLLLRIELRS